jgi:YHS domain-containing protein
LTLIIVGSFIAGAWVNQRTPTGSAAPAGRKILYYVDPMHPAYKSDKPGIAPDCGMELVPVYEDGNMSGAAAGASSPPGSVTISAETQQLVGVRTALAERKAATHSLRIVGRVAAAEDRTYKIIAPSEGWVEDTLGPTSGSLVKKGEAVISLFSLDFLTAQQNYLSALQAYDRPAGPRDPPGVQPDQSRGLARPRSTLRSLGMSDHQIEKLGRDRMPMAEIMYAAPADGLVLARNVSPGQWVERGAELYRIADLRQVWILADVFKSEAKYVRPGTVARASLPDESGEVFRARVAEVLPQFDETTRTLKVRLEADNPGLVLRPGMFLDVEIQATRPPALTVPVDAVVDSGVKQIVYVDKGEGVFEPRRVETGWRAGDQVEILKGLMDGEKIVVSGTFLIDSESRMKAAAGIYGETSEDPVCGMEVDQSKARAAGHVSLFNGQTYYFCSDECKVDFDKAPARYTVKAGSRQEETAGRLQQAAGSKRGQAGRGAEEQGGGGAEEQRAKHRGQSVEGGGQEEAGSWQRAAGSQKPTSGGEKMEAPHAGHDHTSDAKR